MTLTELRRVHPPEDEILLQYLVPATCKAAAVLGMVSEGWCRGHPVMAGCRGCSLSLRRLVPNLHSKYETLENSVSIGALPRGPGSVLRWARPGVGPGTPRSCGHHGGSRPRRASCVVDMGPTPPQVPWHPSSPCRASCQQGLPPGHHVVTAALRFRPQGPSSAFSLPSGSELCERRPGLLRGCPTRRPLGRPRAGARAGPRRLRPGLAPARALPHGIGRSRGFLLRRLRCPRSRWQ